jgi:hypothetical protein
LTPFWESLTGEFFLFFGLKLQVVSRKDLVGEIEPVGVFRERYTLLLTILCEIGYDVVEDGSGASFFMETIFSPLSIHPSISGCRSRLTYAVIFTTLFGVRLIDDLCRISLLDFALKSSNFAAEYTDRVDIDNFAPRACLRFTGVVIVGVGEHFFSCIIPVKSFVIFDINQNFDC